MPKFALVSQQKQLHDPAEAAKITIDQVSYIFGIVTFVAGIVGVWVGAEVARRWRKFDMRADALVCGFGVLMSAPFLFFCMYIADKYIILMWVSTTKLPLNLLLYIIDKYSHFNPGRCNQTIYNSIHKCS